MATGNMHKNFAKFGHAVFELCKQTNRQTNKQTNKQTDILIIIFCTLPGSEVKINQCFKVT